MSAYIIQKGDNLSSIASRYGTTVPELVRLNGIRNPNLIYTGDTLNIPEIGGAAASSVPEVKAPVFEVPKAVSSQYADKKAELSKLEQTKPAYQSEYDKDLADIYDKIISGGAFSYDPQSDPLYTAYKAQYQNLGRLSMEDTAAKAASLSGGYGNSYAATAAAQQYDSYLSKMNEALPSFASLSRSNYDSDRAALSDKLSAVGAMKDDEYQKYKDSLSEYYKELDLKSDDAENEYSKEYQEYLAAYEAAASENEREYKRALEAAKASGDYSGMKKFGWTTAQIMLASSSG